MTNGTALTTLLAEKRFSEIDASFQEALLEPLAKAEYLLAALRGLARAGQKGRVQALAGAVESLLKPQSSDPAIGRLRWSLLKEAVRGGGTPSTTTGFHKLFEEAIRAAYPDSPSLPALLGRVKFLEAKEPADGLARIERAEKWLPFEVGRCFAMPGRGAGRVTEMNFALDSIRVDFETAKGIAIPIGVAAKNLIPLPEGHFLREKLSNAAGMAARVRGDAAGTLAHVIRSYGRAISLTELKEALMGLVGDSEWGSWWNQAKKDHRVITHGSGKATTIEWNDTTESADEALLKKFEKVSLKEKLEIYRRNQKRSPELVRKLGELLAEDASRHATEDPARAIEIAYLLEGIPLRFSVPDLVPENPMALLVAIADRMAREHVLEIHAEKFPARTAQLHADWLLKEEDVRTLESIDRRLLALDPETRELTLERLLKAPRSGARAFVWYCQKATADEAFRRRLTANVLGKLVDAVSWDELGAAIRSKVREMFDRTGLVAIWLMKQATVEEARSFLDVLARHHELEPHRRDALLAAAGMRFPELRKKGDDDETFFTTAEAIEAKRAELERILKVDIPENTKGIALAAAEGDLSENFEYKARRDKQQLLSARAGKLQDELGKARPLDPATIDATEVRPGTRVTVRTGGVEKVLTLLGPWDSKPEEGVYSYLSDLGKALLGKTPGETATVLGQEAEVLKVEPWR